MNWRLHHRSETESTNLDARNGEHGDVFTADFQSSGKGRLNHRWLSPPGVNLLMSAVLSVEDLAPEHAATLPLAIGLAVVKALPEEERGEKVSLKWPNDVLIGRRKVAGILCERVGGKVIAGIGLNVKEQQFPPEIADRATFLGGFSVEEARDRVLAGIADVYGRWSAGGFDAVYREIRAVDCLQGRTVAVFRTDDDDLPVEGQCGGITVSGALDVGGEEVFAGEAHISEVS
jgi:BirA family biotin operon repressor/biotin-[acetyl-CoA-carboxylase] ligase